MLILQYPFQVGCLLLEKGHINTGDHVALIYPPGVDLIASFYGCLYVGAVPVTIRPPHPQNLQSTVNTVRTVVEVSKSSIVLSTLTVIKLLKSKVCLYTIFISPVLLVCS